MKGYKCDRCGEFKPALASVKVEVLVPNSEYHLCDECKEEFLEWVGVDD